MLMDATFENDPASLVPESVYSGPAQLSVLEREFARAYVLTGGNATKAAVIAGYSEHGANVAGYRCLTRPRVLGEIKRLSITNAQAYLPIAIRVLLDIATDPNQDARARVQAANSLLDRGGLATKGAGLTVGVQVNVNGSQVNELKEQIWAARTARLSDSVSPMSDTPMIEHQPEGMGGDAFQGPSPPAVSIPASSTENSSQFTGLPTWPEDDDADHE